MQFVLYVTKVFALAMDESNDVQDTAQLLTFASSQVSIHLSIELSEVW